jgi:hypothetical protein
MSNDASEALGGPELAGTLVNPKGLTKKMTASVAAREVGGIAGSMAQSVAMGSLYEGAPEVPQFGRVGYVAVTDTEIALVKTKAGALKMKVTDEVLARVPRDQIKSAEMDQGRLLSHLRIVFENGRTWEFDVPKMGKKTAQAVIRALGGRLV